MAESKDHIEKLLEQHVAQISEHVTAVQIIVTGKESARYANGSGCWYSRMGAIREFVINDNAEIADRVRRLNAKEEE
jgi:hypothetical protein